MKLIIQPLILLTIIKISISHINPKCEGKRFRCVKSGLTKNQCVNVTDAFNKNHLLKECSSERSYCNHTKAAYGKPVYCQKAQPEPLLVPGEFCNEGVDC